MIRGSVFSGIGSVLMLITGAYLRLSILEHWGMILFILGLALIGYGLLPYRILTYLELHPHKLVIHDDHWDFYMSRYELVKWRQWTKQRPLEESHQTQEVYSDKRLQDILPTFTIPKTCIDKAEYYETRKHYGIRLFFKTPLQERVIVKNPSFNMRSFLGYSQSKFGCDLFLPYFTKRSFEQLKSTLLPAEE